MLKNEFSISCLCFDNILESIGKAEQVARQNDYVWTPCRREAYEPAVHIVVSMEICRSEYLHFPQIGLT